MCKPDSAIAGQIARMWICGLSLAWAAAWGAVLLGAGGAAATPGDILYVLETDLPLRVEPRADSAVKGIMRHGQKVLEFSREAGWVSVGVFGAIGLEGWLPAASLGRTLEGAGATVPGVPHGQEGDSADRPAPPAAAPPFDLMVEGSPGLSYSGECRTLGTGGTTVERSFSGLVPARYRFEAAALRCILRKRDAFGRLIVTLFQYGRPLVRAETAAPYNHVRVRSNGPWGRARASRGAIAVPQFTPPERLAPLVPPLRGPIVPPLSGSGGATGGIPSIPPAP